MIYTFEFLNEIDSNLEQSMPPVTEGNDGGAELLDLSPSIKIKAAMYLLYNILDDYMAIRVSVLGRQGGSFGWTRTYEYSSQMFSTAFLISCRLSQFRNLRNKSSSD